jgi:hypothetical protein
MSVWTWENILGQPSHNYKCGHCGLPLASEKGWRATRQEQVGPSYQHVLYGRIYICHQCNRPTFFDAKNGTQTPGITFGNTVQNITDESLKDIYEEARRATSASCYTAAVLCCRKLLMHLAVAKGAKENDTFKNYVDFLSEKNHVPVACKDWVDQIRDAGNDANHEIKMMKREDAEHLVSFCEMLLKITYEFPAVAKARKMPQAAVAA